VGQEQRNARDVGECIVTGASEGIGEAFARALAKRGRPLLLVARRGARLDAIASEIRAAHGVAVRTLPVDLSTTSGIDTLVDAALDEGRRPAMLVNNAGFGLYGDVVDTDPQRLVDMIRLNVEAVVVLARRLAPAMVDVEGAAILNVASTAAFQSCRDSGFTRRRRRSSFPSAKRCISNSKERFASRRCVPATPKADFTRWRDSIFAR
jgi:short-subunit dehydrogenase